ncbi:hypothetical protein AM501_26865 [Aneurinibacillus migulanus]|uniref:phage tail tube protein n=1 Tax=Aneurinibacillus TaxID=55079 RepID=UPI0005BD1C92|nr:MULTISPECIES: phage tail tube protein [Aneurinibacillus]KIV55054.1 hypothetical protein TS64_12300 [Aneurinibacillus migulanus]KPD05339.1 hypothetical protein AM501_26865 [Aneurinibacillus migulanus]
MGAYDKNLPALNPRKVARGKYGNVYNSSGEHMASVTKFEAKVDFDKQKIKRSNAFMDGNRIMGGAGKGKMTLYLTDAAMIKEISQDPDALFDFLGEVNDPDEYTQEANYKIAILNINYDGVPLLQYDVTGPIEIDLDFTFDDWEWKEIAGRAVPASESST